MVDIADITDVHKMQFNLIVSIKVNYRTSMGPYLCYTWW